MIPAAVGRVKATLEAQTKSRPVLQLGSFESCLNILRLLGSKNELIFTRRQPVPNVRCETDHAAASLLKLWPVDGLVGLSVAAQKVIAIGYRKYVDVSNVKAAAALSHSSASSHGLVSVLSSLVTTFSMLKELTMRGLHAMLITWLGGEEEMRPNSL